MQDRIRTEIKQIGPVSLIIVDTAAAYFEGDDENSNTQFGDYARRTLRPLTTMAGERCSEHRPSTSPPAERRAVRRAGAAGDDK
jgi:hypothetical protein